MERDLKTAVITTVFNGQNSIRIRRNAERFKATIASGADLFGVSLGFEGVPQIPDFATIRADRKNFLWQKERLLNKVAASLSPDYDAIAWVDADVYFTNPNWLEETEALLLDFPVVQLFERVHYTDSSGRIVQSIPSLAQTSRSQTPVLGPGAPGFAWCARREILDNGLYDREIVGGGDRMMVNAWAGNFHFPRLSKYSLNWRRDWLRWAAPQYRSVKRRIGCITGEIIHSYHGTTFNRQYGSRLDVLFAHEFDPTRDIRVNCAGIWEWATDKPEMHEAVANYFRARRDDE